MYIYIYIYIYIYTGLDFDLFPIEVRYLPATYILTASLATYGSLPCSFRFFGKSGKTCIL